MNSLTWLGKQAMNEDRCDYCAQHEHDDSCCFHPLENPSRSDEGLERCLGREEGTEPAGAPRFLRSAMSQPISRLPLLLSVALVCRCYTDLEIAKKNEIKRLQISGLSVASGVFLIVWKNASLRLAKFSKFWNLGAEFGSFKSALRPTLMGMKNLYENGPNPFF